MSSATSSQMLRARLRRQLEGGASERGGALSDAKLVSIWEEFLPLHIGGARPGRAIALLDVQRMLESRRDFITSMGSAPSNPRELSEAEVRTISDWLAKHRAETPAAASELRATEVFLCPASTVV